MQKIVFFGSSKFVIPVVEVLQRDFNLVLIVTTEKEPHEPVISYANSKSIPVLSVSSLADENALRQLKEQNAELGVVANFGIIIPKAIIDAFLQAIINIHPSLLPKYRGPTPVQTALLKGEQKTGVTIIKIDNEVDHGPILHQEDYEIKPSDTSEALLTDLFQKGANSLSKTISEYSKGTLNPTDQIHQIASFTNVFSKKNGYFDSENPPPADQLNRMIRAYYPWPGVWTKYALIGKEIIVKLLPNSRVQVEGKNPMSYKDFKNGYAKGEELLGRLGLDKS